VENSGVKGKTAKNGSSLSSGSGGTGNGSAAIPGDTSTPDQVLQSTRVELSHLVDPFDGTYKKKVSIPKNFKGNLYLAGLNVSALQSKLVKVRFNFGVEGQSVVLDATVARAPGIIPQTDIQVLVVDMNSRPFSKMVLGYDLFDYNNYSNPAKEPVSDPRDSGLYCRGLKLEDDPTYDKTFDDTMSSNPLCTGKCLYAYAKITDATMYNTTSLLTSVPTLPQVWTKTNGVRSPSYAKSASSMCLPDSPEVGAFGVGGFNDLFNQSFGPGTLTWGIPVSEYETINGQTRLIYSALYKGPYRAINTNGWKIDKTAIINSQTGLFETPFLTSDGFTGYRSLMFPRAGKIKLNLGVHYFGSTLPFGTRTSTEMLDSAGTSTYVDGCNLRAMNYNPATTESISSCNVNGSIEIFYRNAAGAEVSVTTDRTIKLQLLRPSATNSEGKEVLTSAFKRCESSSTCGSDECCFNSRCWSKDLVTQCVDQTPVIGNQPVGNNCASDFECSSLCCNLSTGSCAPHNTNGAAPILCNKPAGQRCVAREFCKPEFVETCKLVKLPNLSPEGKVQCTLRCPAVSTYGECTAGFCVPPAIPPVPTFDPANPDCSKAVDP
jgi:hypothetical protein